MNDLEVCKRIAEIEGEYESAITRRDNYNEYLVHVQDKAEFTRWYNPLTDDALCFKLMIKYEVDFINDKQLYEALIIEQDGSLLGSSINKNPNKAICLAIIEANND